MKVREPSDQERSGVPSGQTPISLESVIGWYSKVFISLSFTVVGAETPVLISSSRPLVRGAWLLP